MFRHLLKKEILQIRRNTFLPKLIVVFPIVVMCVMPWVMNMEVKNVRVAVVDNDRSTPSQQLVRRIEASSSFIFTGQQPSYQAALEAIGKSRTDVVLVIPRHYGKALSQGQPSQVLIAANAVNGTKGAMGSAYLTQIVMRQLRGGDEALSVLNLYNKQLSYKRYMIPALFAILLMMMCGFLPTLNIVGEKETGTIEQINVTPVPRHTFILAKLIPYWIIALLLITLCLLLSWLLYGITCQGSLLLVYLLALLLALFFSSFGLIISNYSDTMQQAILVMWFFVVCLMLLSGLFTPARSMPAWAYATTYVNPMHYFITAIRTVFVRGGDLQSIVPQCTALALLSVATSLWAVASYRKNR